MSANTVKQHFLAFRELIGLLTRHRQLTWEMSKREVTDQYLGQVLGAFWAFGHPLLIMGVYVFLFALVLKVRVRGAADMPLDYTTYLLAGLIPWLGFQHAMAKGSLAIVSNAGLVKQVVFPIEVLPVKGVISSLTTLLVSFSVLIAYVLVKEHRLPWTYALLPALVFFQTLYMIGASYFLSAVNVYFRDVKDFVQVFSIVGLYFMPVIYTPGQAPAMFRPVLYLNPFSYQAWCYQDALCFGRFDHWWAWIVYVILSVSSFYAGYRVFRRLKTMFGDAL